MTVTEKMSPDERDAAPAAEKAPLADVWIDRDLGWLDFNRRVLAEAQDPRTPLLERAKFLAIFTSNLDEFFMKRIAVLRENPTPAHLAHIALIHERLQPDLEAQARCFTAIVTALADHQIHLLRWEQLSEVQQHEASRRFDSQVSPALTPLLQEPGRRFRCSRTYRSHWGFDSSTRGMASGNMHGSGCRPSASGWNSMREAFG
jgi:polyphosphate kinase